ncbi:hypothetical protein LZ480_02595 [Solibacillus sp. MA9]|uniref:DUF4350 domain-containing protein n=1 Tax=Solibacillus palustris TaxID=2908203 RepID=A0ABS9U8U5_9BACL|nr:hypothetical protein [Solibacillus sp. MA9]MCH7320765.1 hypothetical protein [Solibacillus sp. MA9]
MKKYVMLLIFLVTMFAPLMYGSAEMNIDVDYGFEGKGKQDTPIAVTFTIQNDERTFDGELVTTYANNYLLQRGEVIPLQLAPNEVVRKKVYLNYLPYEIIDNSTGKFVYLYDDSIEKGDESKDYRVTHNKPELTSYDAFMIGVFGDKQLASALQQLRAIQQSRVVDISEYEITSLESVQQLEDLALFNMIFLTQELDTLTEVQQKAILGWIQNGGQLVIDGDVSSTALEPYKALTASSATKTINAEQLQQFTGQERFNKVLTVHDVQPIQGAHSFKIDETVLAARKQIGSGALIQTAFSLTDATVSQNDNAAYLMAKLLDFDVNFNTSTPESDLSSNVVPVNALFASFEFSLWKIVVVFGLYIFLLGPVLYFFLKRKDKREYAWWIIPAFALVVSVALFLVGAKDRIVQPQIQQMAVVKISDNASEQYFAQSLLSNRGGDYQFSLTNDMKVASYGGQSFGLRDFQNGRWGYVKQQQDHKTLTLKNVPYWDVESFIGSGAIDIGKLDVQLVNENGMVTGTVRNDLTIDLKEVQIWTGLQFINIGDIKQGESKHVNEKLVSSLLVPNTLPVDQTYYDRPTPETIDEVRKGRLLGLANTLVMDDQSPVIIGYSNTADIGAQFAGKAKMQSTVLVVQPFTASVNFSDDVTINGDLMLMKYSTDLYGGVKDQLISGQDSYYLDPADYKVTYQLPQSIMVHNFSWESLRYELYGGAISSQIYNVKTNQYESLPSEYSTDNVDDYIENDMIQFKWHVSDAVYSDNVKLPMIELKGAMKQ